MLKTKKEIKKWLDEMDVSKYTINDDLTVYVANNVDISGRNLTEIPVQFSAISGRFNCAYNELISLKGSPYIVLDDFECSNNKLKSIEHSPLQIRGHFMFQENEVTSLKWAPNDVSGEFMCGCNPIQNIDGIEHINANGFSHWAKDKHNCIQGLESYYGADGPSHVSLMLILNSEQLKEIKSKIILNLELNFELNNNIVQQKKIKL